MQEKNFNSQKDSFIILSIQSKRRKKKEKIELSDGSALYILTDLVKKEGLVENQVVTHSYIKNLKQCSAVLEAKAKAISLISKSMHSKN
ncbi:unnamed protein product, partial [marine sediment metagenome]